MYLFNEFLMNILNDINTLLCPSKNKSNTIKLTMRTSCYGGHGQLCVRTIQLYILFGVMVIWVFMWSIKTDIWISSTAPACLKESSMGYKNHQIKVNCINFFQNCLLFTQI